MAVYVDSANRRWKRGGQWSHLFADSERELIAFALAIGCKLEWLQRPFPHFDVPGFRRDMAVKAGAIEVNSRFAVMKRKQWRNEHA